MHGKICSSQDAVKLWFTASDNISVIWAYQNLLALPKQRWLNITLQRGGWFTKREFFQQKKRKLIFRIILAFLQFRCWQRAIFPGGGPPSIVASAGLYDRVRDGNGWFTCDWPPTNFSSADFLLFKASAIRWRLHKIFSSMLLILRFTIHCGGLFRLCNQRLLRYFAPAP